MANHSAYPLEFRRAAAAEVALREAGQPAMSAVARKLRVPPSTLRNWVASFFPDFAPAEQPHAPSGSAPHLPLIGLARHARCGDLLRAASLPRTGRVYACLRCRIWLNGNRVDLAAATAVTARAPQLAHQPHPGWWEVLLGLRVDDRCHVVALTWHPSTASRRP